MSDTKKIDTKELEKVSGGITPVKPEGTVTGYYTVKEGDNIISIASFLGVSAIDLIRWNNLDPMMKNTQNLTRLQLMPGSTLYYETCPI